MRIPVGSLTLSLLPLAQLAALPTYFAALADTQSTGEQFETHFRNSEVQLCPPERGRSAQIY